MSNVPEPRDLNELYRAFENADFYVRKKYRDELDQYEICDLPKWLVKCLTDETTLGSNIQFSKIEKLVYDKAENTTDKLITVYNTLASHSQTAIVLLIIANEFGTELYYGVAQRFAEDNAIDTEKRGNKSAALDAAFEANFPGSRIINKSINPQTQKPEPIDAKEIISKAFDEVTTVSSVVGVAALRNKELRDNDQFVQGIEKLIESMRGKRYTAILIADCKSTNEVDSICTGYEDIYSCLYPFLQSQQTLATTDSETNTDSFIKGITETTNDSVAMTKTKSHTLGKTSSDTVGTSVTVGGSSGFMPGPSASVSANYSHTWGRNESDTDQEGETKTQGSARSLNTQNSVAKSMTVATNEGVQITYQNRAVKSLLDIIDNQINHIRSCEAFGVYDFGAYFLASESGVAETVASVYDSLMRGDESGNEQFSVTTWRDKKAQDVIEYLKRFYHPLIAAPDLSKKLQEDGKFPILPITPTTIISGKELALQMSLPKKSIRGLPVIEKAAFGRDVVELHRSNQGYIALGNIYHMGNIEGQKLDKPDSYVPNVKLSIQELASHTFITGSTGSGKSNTVYQILSELKQQNEQKTFLVVEPAKGEYASALGGGDVSVYGTNPKKNVLLRINPFSFPTDIHVLEHLERLASIFNVCWPMYAAMPAILKDAMERAYIDAGWDLRTSENKHNNNLFPTFEDVLRNIKKVLDESDYSADNKGDYTGALVTRLRALTNGLYGMIFSSNEISNEDLFDKNVIVDLSRVGSNETKSLIMGLLILKLSEYRMSTHTGANENLKHVTVLEEAHNILKRTSTEQMSESANLVGKSVEMLSNAIAEMRTYGEGFIIADQSPGNMDMSVIRNTNTKIIMRLPDYSDRELVGRAASLNDEQIVELSKLERGVAAVIQGNWLEAVLCKVKKFESTHAVVSPSKPNNKEDDMTMKDKLIKELIKLATTKNLDKSELLSLKDAVLKSNLTASIKCSYMEIIDDKTDDKAVSIRKIIYELLGTEKITRFVNDASDIVDIRDEIAKDLHLSEYVANDVQRNIVIGLILYEQSERNPCYNKVFQLYTERLRGGLL